MDWLDLLAVQGTLKSFLQHHSSKASILMCSAFFIIQLSHPYMTTGKAIALTRWIFVGKVMSPLFNMLSSLVITFHISIPIYILYIHIIYIHILYIHIHILYIHILYIHIYIYIHTHMSFLVYSSAVTSTLFYWSHRSKEDHRGCDIRR